VGTFFLQFDKNANKLQKLQKFKKKTQKNNKKYKEIDVNFAYNNQRPKQDSYIIRLNI
jgi:SepF-like predicted cell division protein (DUF552 family)